MSIRDGIARLLGLQARSSSTAIGSGYVAAAPVLSGTYITPQTALGLTAVYAAINVISRDVATLPLNVYRKLPNGGREIAEDHPVQELVRWQPNDDMDAHRLRRDSMGHTLGWGNGLQEIVRNKRTGTPEALEMLHPSKTVPKRTESKSLYYELDGDKDKRLSPENVLHFAGLGFNGISGYTPLTVARQSIGTGFAAEQFGASFFGNGAVSKGILKLARKLSPAGKSNLRNSINQVHQGAQSAHQFMILEEGMDWVNTQINPDDAQFIATRQFTVIEIARLYSLPPHKIGDYSEAHINNVEDANLDYIVTTLAGWLSMLEYQYNLKLLTRFDRRKYVILHDMSALMRGNMAARVAYYQGMRNMGCMSADDILSAEGKNPLGPKKGGDKYLVQMQYQPLERAGEPPINRLPKDPPAKQTNAFRPGRHNPNHGPDGKFSAGHGGSGGLGGHGLAGDDARIAQSNALGEQLADHPDPVTELARSTGHAPDAAWDLDARQQHRDLLAGQAEERKSFDRDQAGEHKEMIREQGKEAKEFERDQRKDLGEFDREQAKDASRFDRKQAREKAEDDQTAEEHAAAQAEAKGDFQAGQQLDREDFHQEQARDLESFKTEQAEARQAFSESQADDKASFLSNQRDERVELVSTLALDLLETHAPNED
jgi:HK97 family phage portal protein